MKPQQLIKLENVGVHTQGRWLVRHIDLEICRSEIVTLIGPNGSGKSTTAKLALGVLDAHEGKVTQIDQLKVGYVPQKVSLDWTLPMKVERLICLTRKYSHQEIENALAEVGAAHLMGKDVQGLSGGEFQRVLLARAMIGKPDLMVLDEPVQGVDYTGEVALYDLITQIRDRTGCGILLISHDLHVVMAQTDRVICLNGHVCCQGTPKSVVSSPQYLELFGARAAETLAIYRHHHDHTHTEHGHIHQHDHKCGAEGQNCTHEGENL